ncbi:helix-turn-helix domain-containing protein [Nocardia sp. 348MFTsu5.1]|uniref:helix-turn-helix domain-containing protein n=1 Tax=Nocardia sp. 348MFTsu5.1 TaxID=1172185 RepID=UPI0003606506|nr:helix-turn-helix domain-containing protein [Nocardia sp. 348MFTsu5.1]
MRELAGRLDALDADAGSALRVVAYFDELTHQRAGLESVVRGAAILSDHTALLVDGDAGLRMRITPDGVRRDTAGAPLPHWCRIDIEPGCALWLELPEPAGSVAAVVLERAASAIRAILDRPRSRLGPGRDRDPDLIDVILDPSASEHDRARAAQHLGLTRTGLAHVVASSSGRIDIQLSVGDADSGVAVPVGSLGRERVGVGPAVAPKDLPGTETLALTAVRFTAEGDESDPGPRVVYVDRLGGLLLLAHAADTYKGTIPDVTAVQRAAEAAPWMLATLHAVSTTSSLRAAATSVRVHHSTMQGRLVQAERRLGWSLRDDEGRNRLNVALILRRLSRNGPVRQL